MEMKSGCKNVEVLFNTWVSCRHTRLCYEDPGGTGNATSYASTQKTGRDVTNKIKKT